ncbi:MAG: hypothetical protein ACO3O0_07795, partial [Bacteroidia bacterium]
MPYTLWGTGEAGGIVFYDKGTVSNGWRFMERTNSYIQSPYGWGCNNVNISGATDSTIGGGLNNSLAIAAAGCSNGVLADLCLAYNQNGFDDWHMPSIMELWRCG